MQAFAQQKACLLASLSIFPLPLIFAAESLPLRQMLAKVQKFFTQWAAFRKVADRAKRESRSAHVTCVYELRINMVEDDLGDWIYPTKSMLEEWGYSPKGIQSYGRTVDESKLVIANCR